MTVAGNSRVGFGHEQEMEPSDASLWARSRAGDTEAFALLFERHATAIYNYCFRRLGDWTTAEDMLSVVFLEAWRRREKELPEDKVLPWLYGIATNVIRNQRRSERRFAAALRRMPSPPPEATFTDGVDVVVEGRLDANGTFQATTLLAKCASRYENAPEKYRETPGYQSATPRA